jgi:5-bromo-4-chloroindolyl phosphate hydrolysis protein
MKFSNVIIRIKDYFTANIYRKVFFSCFGLSIICAIITAFTAAEFMLSVSVVLLITAIFGSLIDTMLSRVDFNRRVVDIQRKHYEKIIQNGEDKNGGEIPSTFTADEYNYIKKKKINHVLMIMLKTSLILILFVLLSK